MGQSNGKRAESPAPRAPAAAAEAAAATAAPAALAAVVAAHAVPVQLRTLMGRVGAIELCTGCQMYYASIAVRPPTTEKRGPNVWGGGTVPAYSGLELTDINVINLSSLKDLESSFNCFGWAVQHKQHCQIDEKKLLTWSAADTKRLLNGTIELQDGTNIGHLGTDDTASAESITSLGYRVIFFPPSQKVELDFHWAREARLRVEPTFITDDIWIEKSGTSGPLQIWASLEDLQLHHKKCSEWYASGVLARFTPPSK